MTKSLFQLIKEATDKGYQITFQAGLYGEIHVSHILNTPYLTFNTWLSGREIDLMLHPGNQDYQDGEWAKIFDYHDHKMTRAREGK